MFVMFHITVLFEIKPLSLCQKIVVVVVLLIHIRNNRFGIAGNPPILNDLRSHANSARQTELVKAAVGVEETLFPTIVEADRGLLRRSATAWK